MSDTDFNDVLRGQRGDDVGAQVTRAIKQAPRKVKPFNQRRPYGTVPTDLWLGERLPAFRKLSTDGKLLALYLLSSPHANMLGLYVLPMAYIVNDTGLTTEAIGPALDELKEAELVSYDDDRQYVFVQYFVATQVLTDGESLSPSDNRTIHAQLVFNSLSGAPFRDQLYEAYGVALNLQK